MTSSNFIDNLAAKGYKKSDAKIIVKDVFNTIGEMLVNNEDVRVPRFGTFSTKIRSERVGTSPITHEQIIVPALRLANFKPSNILKDALKGENLAYNDLSEIRE